MIQRSLTALIAALVASAVVAVNAQSPAVPKGTTGKSAVQVPRTPDGHPDFQGSWTTETYTPFERPAEFKEREYFTEAEAEAYAKRALERFLDQPDTDAHYDNSIWMTEKGPKGMSTLRTSIVTTPDGKIPPVNEEGRKRAADRALTPDRLIDRRRLTQDAGVDMRPVVVRTSGDAAHPPSTTRRRRPARPTSDPEPSHEKERDMITRTLVGISVCILFASSLASAKSSVGCARPDSKNIPASVSRSSMRRPSLVIVIST